MAGYYERRYKTQDGLTLYYRDYGDPDGSTTPLLCLPGLTRNSKDFHREASRLSKKRRVICPDYRGRGESEYDPTAKSYLPTIYLNDIRHLLAVTGIGRVIVIGTSLGGLLAMGMGAAMPTTLVGVVLNDIGPEIPNGGLDKIIDFISTDRPHGNWDSAVKDLRQNFPHLKFDTEQGWRDAAQATWREGNNGKLHFDWDIRLAAILSEGPPIPNLWPLFNALGEVPTLAIRGALSDMLSAETFEKMAMIRPNLQQLTVPDAGHVPTLSELVVQTKIDRFLATLPKN
ncbi:MAG: alpha/beta hydrolase [Rhodospirillaceae bacterium]|nr:alpha/beta hydrolase [Rhodospirillaceae bacterium]